MTPTTGGKPPTRRWKPSARSVLTVAAGVTLAAVATYSIYHVLSALRLLITIVLVAIFLAAALEPLVWRYQKLPVGRGKTLGRKGAVAAAMLTVVGGLISLVAVLIPAIYRAGTILVNNREQLAEFASKAARSIGVRVDAATLDTQISGFLTKAGAWISGSGGAIAGSVVGGLISSLAVAFLVWHLTVEHETIKVGIARLMRNEQKRNRFLDIWDLAMERVGKFIGTTVVLALAAGAVGAAGAVIAGLPHPAGIGAWVFLANLIPIGGGFIGSTLPVAVAVVVDLDGGVGLVATIVTIIIHLGWQAIDNYWLRPVAFGSSLEIHPAVAFVAIIGGTSLMGAVGTIVALPLTAVIIALFAEWKDGREEANGGSEEANGQSEKANGQSEEGNAQSQEGNAQRGAEVDSGEGPVPRVREEIAPLPADRSRDGEGEPTNSAAA